MSCCSPDRSAPDSTDLELELRASLAVAAMMRLARRRDGSKCACCGFSVDPRNTAVVSRTLGLVYHPRCAP